MVLPAVFFCKSEAASVSPLTLAILCWSPSSPGAAVLSEEELGWLQSGVVQPFILLRRRDVPLCLGVRRTVGNIDFNRSSSLFTARRALRDIPQAPPGFPVYLGFFGHVRQSGQGIMVWRLPRGRPRA